MAIARRNPFLILFLITLFVVCISLLYSWWYRGQVVSSLAYGRGSTLCIRRIPTNPPGLNDGYLYRCEVWVGGILTKASTYRWDSFEASYPSISIASDGSAIFHIDRHEISCSSPEARSASWKGGGW